MAANINRHKRGTIITSVPPYVFRDTYLQATCIQVSLIWFMTLRMNVTVNYKGKGSPYSITERRVPQLVPVLGSQSAGDVSHKPGGRLPLLLRLS